MDAIKLEAVVSEDGILHLALPQLRVGEHVEVIVLHQVQDVSADPYPLRGTPFRYDDPFTPVVSPSDWNAAS